MFPRNFLDVSYSSDEENLNVEFSDDLDSEVESFTGYGNEPEYTEQEISKLINFISGSMKTE